MGADEMWSSRWAWQPQQEHKLQSSVPAKIRGEKEDASGYLDLIRPLLVTLQLLGRTPTSLVSSGLTPRRQSWALGAYCLLVYSVQSGLTIKGITKVLEWRLKRPNQFIWLNMLLVFVHNFAVPVCFWLDASLLVSYLKQWNSFQSEYKRVMRRQLRFRTKRLVWVMTALIPPFTALTIYLNRGYLGGLTFLDAMLIYTPILVTFGAVNTIWMVTLNQLTIVSRDIRRKLLQRSTGGAEAGQLRLLWFRSGRLFAELGQVFGNSTLLFGSSNLVNLLCMWYYLIAALGSPHGLEPYFFVVGLMSLLFFTSWITFIEQIHRTGDAIGAEFIRSLLQMDITSRSELYIREIKLIFLTMEVNMPRMDIKGYLTANRNLTIAFLGSIFTYLIILFQSVPASPSVMSDIYEPDNDF